MTIKPITPKEIIEKIPKIPDFAISAFNTLIEENCLPYEKNIESIIHIDEIIDFIIKNNPELNLDAKKIYNANILDVESLYKSVGWVVNFRDNNFIFTGKK